MEQFEKHLSNEFNILNSLFFKIKLKGNKSFNKRFEQYKDVSNNLKNMFLISEAEKEIRKDKNLLMINALTDKYLMNNNKDEDILNFINFAF